MRAFGMFCVYAVVFVMAAVAVGILVRVGAFVWRAVAGG